MKALTDRRDLWMGVKKHPDILGAALILDAVFAEHTVAGADALA